MVGRIHTDITTIAPVSLHGVDTKTLLSPFIQMFE
jgi:hypothetical protein